MLHCRHSKAVGKIQWNRWLSNGPGRDGEEVDDEEDIVSTSRGERQLENTGFTPHSFLYIPFCCLYFFNRVWACHRFVSGSQVFSAEEYPSRTLGTFISKGIPGVRECWPLHILLHHLSPLEVGLWNLVCVRLSHNRLIRGRRGIHHVQWLQKLFQCLVVLYCIWNGVCGCGNPA